MAQSSPVQSLGWTRRSAAMTMLMSMAEQRAQSAARLVQAIEASGKTYEQVAHDAGVAVKTISRWANRKHDPSRTTVKRVAKALKVESGWLWEPPAPLALGANGDPLADLRTQLDRIEQNQNDLATLLDTISGQVEAIHEQSVPSPAEQQPAPRSRPRRRAS